MFESMKPPFSYHGGKQRMASKIIPYIPKHTVYAEPFCGGATLLFKKPWPKVTNADHYREIINDTNEQVINFFRVVQSDGERLASMLEVMPNSEAEHRDAKRYRGDDKLLQAYYFFINTQQSFANTMFRGWARGVFGKTIAVSYFSSALRVRNYISRMGHVQIACQDALKFIKQWDSPQTFFYCDPPYPNSDQGHYKGYTLENFIELIKLLETCKSSAIVSHHPLDIPLPDGWKQVDFEAHCFSSGKGKTNSDKSRKATSEELGNRKRIERLWIKPASEPREEIKKLYASGKYDCFEDRAFSQADAAQRA